MIEVYEDKAYVAEYKRQHSLSEDEHEEWWDESKDIIALVTGVNEDRIYQKVRKRKENRLDQYQKSDEKGEEFVVTGERIKIYCQPKRLFRHRFIFRPQAYKRAGS
jgi:23S rRNA (cytosine1962-C5)-methyltransferase